MWLCQCDCNETKVIHSRELIQGKTRSCGCYRSEYVAHKNYKHGGCKRLDCAPEYVVWFGMIERCTNQNSDCYQNYGGRGINVCPAWRDSFATFLHDMGPRPSPKHSIERVDNSKGYAPDNCRWATAIEQANNKRNNTLVTFDGLTLTAAQAWRLHAHPSVSFKTFKSRLKNGWNDQKALLTPIRRL